MTKKEFIVVADALRDLYPKTLVHDQYVIVVHTVADKLAEEYPNFDLHKFVTYCKK